MQTKVFICLFLHQTTTYRPLGSSPSGCLSVYSYIKPQLSGDCIAVNFGVYLSIPTSNHNSLVLLTFECKGVYLSIPTSNHNSRLSPLASSSVFICLFLHQTTTHRPSLSAGPGCLSVYSYIKPQLSKHSCIMEIGVYLSIPTSNHNVLICFLVCKMGVYLSIPTSNHNGKDTMDTLEHGVYLSIPTSNHNTSVCNCTPQSGVYLSIPTSNHNPF